MIASFCKPEPLDPHIYIRGGHPQVGAYCTVFNKPRVGDFAKDCSNKTHVQNVDILSLTKFEG